MENPFNEVQNQIQRPTFLTVICILTFIGSGWSTLSNLYSLFTPGLQDASIQMQQYSNIMQDAENNPASSFLSGFLNSSMEVLQITITHAREIAVCQLILSIVSLLGAIMMFQLRRFGFYLYVAAQILALFILPYFAGFSVLIVIGMTWASFISVVFITLYAVNLKYMKA